MINIPKNDYVQPTEVREEVVQAICEAFLGGCCWSHYHPYSESAYRQADKYVLRHKNDTKFYGFNDETMGSVGIKFNGAEMKQAFRELINAGYHIWRCYDYGTWKAYVVTKRPCIDRSCYHAATEVTEFTDFID